MQAALQALTQLAIARLAELVERLGAVRALTEGSRTLAPLVAAALVKPLAPAVTVTARGQAVRRPTMALLAVAAVGRLVTVIRNWLKTGT